MGLYTRHFCLSEKEMSRSIIYRFIKPSNNELTTSAHKTEDVNRTKNIWFSPSRRMLPGVAADLRSDAG